MQMQDKSQELIAALQRLSAFTGTWSGQGTFLEGAGPGAGSRLTTGETYEWLPGGFFLIHRGWLDFGAGRLDALRVLAYDIESKSYTIHAYDSIGFARVYRGGVQGNIWRFVGEQERVAFTLSDDNGHLDTFWETLNAARLWQPLCKTEEARVHDQSATAPRTT